MGVDLKAPNRIGVEMGGAIVQSLTQRVWHTEGMTYMYNYNRRTQSERVNQG